MKYFSIWPHQSRSRPHLDTLYLKAYFIQLPRSNGSIIYMDRNLIPIHFQWYMKLYLNPHGLGEMNVLIFIVHYNKITLTQHPNTHKYMWELASLTTQLNYFVIVLGDWVSRCEIHTSWTKKKLSEFEFMQFSIEGFWHIILKLFSHLSWGDFFECLSSFF